MVILAHRLMNYAPTFEITFLKELRKNYDKHFVDQSRVFGLMV
jgi:hypothetical protein